MLIRDPMLLQRHRIIVVRHCGRSDLYKSRSPSFGWKRLTPTSTALYNSGRMSVNAICGESPKSFPTAILQAIPGESSKCIIGAIWLYPDLVIVHLCCPPINPSIFYPRWRSRKSRNTGKHEVPGQQAIPNDHPH